MLKATKLKVINDCCDVYVNKQYLVHLQCDIANLNSSIFAHACILNSIKSHPILFSQNAPCSFCMTSLNSFTRCTNFV